MSNLNDIYDEEEEEFVIKKVKSKHVNFQDPDLSEIDLPDDLKRTALQVYRSYGVATHKGKIRNNILYGCFYIAGLKLNKPQIPQQLMQSLKIDLKKRTACEGMVRKIQEKVGSYCKIFTPVDITEPYLVEFEDGAELLQQIKESWESIKHDAEIKTLNIKILAVWLLFQLNLDTETNLCKYYGITEQTYRKETVKINESFNRKN